MVLEKEKYIKLAFDKPMFDESVIVSLTVGVKLEHCHKCQREIIVEHTRKGNVIIWTRRCSYCGFDETEIDDFDKDEVE